MRLTELLAKSGIHAEIARAGDVAVTGITPDSRQVKPGMVFVALSGAKQDGNAFIDDALKAGAVAVVGTGPDARITVRVENVRLALAKMAAAFYTPQPAHMVAVTGTDGKTSTVDFFRQLAAMRGHKAVSIGTLGALGADGNIIYPGSHTTPDPVALHTMLKALADAGYTHAAMEASSHGLHQYRLDGVRLQAAAFTNLTRDHMDYHGTDEAYFAAKQRLFSELLPEGAAAVLNADDRSFATLKKLCTGRRHHLISCGRAGEQLCIKNIIPHPEGQKAGLRIFGKDYTLDLPHVGAFQVYNMLMALGLLAALGDEPETLVPLLLKLKGVPGRMERIASVQGAAAYIDYAHTPAALENALKVLRPHTSGRLLVVFGCGGDRDRGKRPLMGKAAVELADIAIVTDDNPRSENPAAIRREVLSAAAGAKEIADRKEAIYGAVKMLAPGDVLLVAGKGHEKTQIIAGVEHPFSDAAIIREAIAAQ